MEEFNLWINVFRTLYDLIFAFFPRRFFPTATFILKTRAGIFRIRLKRIDAGRLALFVSTC